MKVLMIIPAYNEEKSIVNTVKSLEAFKSDRHTLDYIIVNDGSKDNTRQVCIDNKLNFVDLPMNLGIGGAVQTGYKYALSNDYDYIINLVEEIEKGYDIAIGSRFVKELSEFKSTRIRRIGINFLSRLIKVVSGKRVYDPTSGFRAANRKVIEEFANEYPIDYPEPDTIVSIIKKGYKVSEIPVKMNERKEGTSSLTTNIFKPVYYMVKVSLAIIITAMSTKRGGRNA